MVAQLHQPVATAEIPHYISEVEALSATNTVAVYAIAVPFPLSYVTYDRALNGDIASAQYFDVLMVNAPGIGDRLKRLIRDHLGSGWDVAYRLIGTEF